MCSSRFFMLVVVYASFVASAPFVSGQDAADQPWTRHTILTGLKGSDGVRFRDVNADGLPDCVTGWEQSGAVTICLHPGHKAVREPWPNVRFKSSPAVEDAVFVDLDGDGAVDVITCCEGGQQAVVAHFAPRDPKDYLDASKWQIGRISAAKGQLWMFCQSLEVDGKHGIDLVIGAKSRGATVSWLEAPANPRDLEAWTLHSISPAGWIMSLVAKDMDADGDADILLSDRQGKLRGVRWLENPGRGESLTHAWSNHPIGAAGRETMFLDAGDVDQDGLEDVVANLFEKECLFLRRLDKTGQKWESHSIAHPANVGEGKAASIGDINGDGTPDLVLAFARAKDKSGVVWLSHAGSAAKGPWTRHEISGPAGVKFDMVPLVDLDGDGDLDVVTTEEIDNLGIIWYENPAKAR